MFFWFCNKQWAIDEINKGALEKKVGDGFYNYGRYVFVGVTALVFVINLTTYWSSKGRHWLMDKSPNPIEAIREAISGTRPMPGFSQGIGPLFTAHPKARLVVVGQAPHQSPNRRHSWGMKRQAADAVAGIEKPSFGTSPKYPFCQWIYYPGKGKSGICRRAKSSPRGGIPNLRTCRRPASLCWPANTRWITTLGRTPGKT